MKSVTVLPAKGCRRSRKILEYLQTHQIPFQRIELDSPEGELLMEKYHFLASPGILVDGVSVNPFDLLIQPECRVNEPKLKRVIDLNGE
jgi:glutaredoxin